MRGKTVVLGVTGGIAAYKAAALCSKLAQAGVDVRVMMTRSATQFVQPLTFQTLSRHAVAIDTFDEHDPSVVQHIDLADAADLIVIAPATANVIGKLANGIADDMLTTTVLASVAPVLIAPAMNVHMYDHPAVQHNLTTLKQRGVQIFDPGEGQLACGYIGKGRMAEPEQLFERIAALLSDHRPLQGKRVLITAGGTIERIDPVRYLTNDSSGKMGYAFAEIAKELGAEVTLISGRTVLASPAGVEVVSIESAEEMLHATLERFDHTDIVIKAAAVADYRPASIAMKKIKKSDDILQLELVKNPDILQQLGERKTSQFIVGFAAETEDMERYALDKLQRKRCDLLVANNVTLPGAGFGTDTNIVTLFDEHGVIESLPLMDKRQVARHVMELVAKRIAQRQPGILE
ncbi:MAG: bifunctional phosphopantothenoylcysteine decarboxylase/phosphopantothenate--cysteine ligase CoaBC [Paenibacillaceae bacterium]